ncbi:MAG: NUDIX domain-containing protein [Acetatifactor muris]|nr:NUDIX domain-containing protein [Acetatifactor muris]MCM1528234.1 NUDIX domain-containing protein [Bacteroides sp.]
MKSRLTTLCYIEKAGQYLMLHRISKKDDVNKDKWIGIGGHFEEGESPEDCLLREVREETGLTLISYRFRGIITFCYENHPAEYMCLYTGDAFEGTLRECNEGKLEWVDKDKVRSLNLWDGDVLFLELLRQEIPFFSLKLCYREDGGWCRGVLNGEELELLDICGEDGKPTGHVKERNMVHREGDLHRTVHIWVIRKRADGGTDVLLQKRSEHKDAYPGCYDVSSAGHVRAGDDFETSALRELQEELGIIAAKEDLKFIGFHEGYVENTFWGQPFKDWEISPVYLYEKPIAEDRLILQESEVGEVVFMDYEKVLEGIHQSTFPNCIYPGEFQMIRESMQPGFNAEDVWVREIVS